MSAQNIFCLYLAKQDIKDFDELLSEAAERLIRSGIAKKSSSKNYGDSAAIYVFPGDDKTPRWVTLLKPTFPIVEGVYSRSPCAILAFKKGKSIFALTFSYAHVYLSTSAICISIRLR